MNKFCVSAALAAAVLSASTGCSVIQKENRRTLNALDEAVRIESATGQIAAAPVFVPVGVAALVADAVVVHPLVSVPAAWSDTSRVVWEDPEGSDFYQAMVFLPKVAVTPVVLVGDWGLRVLFGAEF